jgi:hypothetical protein
LTARPHDAPDDGGDATVLRVEPAMGRTLWSVDDANYSLCSEDARARVTRVDDWSPCDIISQSYQGRLKRGILIPPWRSVSAVVDLTFNPFRCRKERSVSSSH